MSKVDLIMNAIHVPTFQEILEYIQSPAREMWEDLNGFIQQNYHVSPKIAYSKCSGKPGWNVKYQKSGKSLCTLYPEIESFVALVVITLDLVPVIEEELNGFEACVLETVKTAKPFNGTKWLMVHVKTPRVLDNVKKLLLMKHVVKN